MPKANRIIPILMTLLVALPAAAYTEKCAYLLRPEFLFGLEFTVTNQSIIDEGNRNPTNSGSYGNPVKMKAWKNLIRRVQGMCKKTGNCETSKIEDKHGPALKVEFNDGYYLTIAIDTAALESNALPQTRSQYLQNMQKLSDYVFTPALQEGLTPHERVGGGHIHISRLAFDEDPLLFRNFLVDFQNRPELIFGAFGNHLGNAAPLAALSPEQRDAFESVLNKFSENPTTINKFINSLHKNVFTKGYFAEWGEPEYYQAYNMTRMNKRIDRATIELRSFRPQSDAQEYLLQITLLQRWINRLKDIDKPIPYQRKDRYHYYPQEIVNAYADLLRDLDLPYDEFKSLLPSYLQNLQPDNEGTSLNYRLSDFIPGSAP